MAIEMQKTPETRAFITFEVNEEAYIGIMTYLGELPAKIANPLINAFAMLEQQAIEKTKK